MGNCKFGGSVGKRVVFTTYGFSYKFIWLSEGNVLKYTDKIIILRKGVKNYFKEIYGRTMRFVEFMMLVSFQLLLLIDMHYQ